MLGSDVASGHKINHEIESNNTGADFPKINGETPMDQEQMAKMFEMFQQMQANGGQMPFGQTAGEPSTTTVGKATAATKSPEKKRNTLDDLEHVNKSLDEGTKNEVLTDGNQS